MRKTVPLLATMAFSLAACTAYDYGYGYDRYAYNPYTYSPVIGTVGLLGSAYGPSFSQAAASACANYASRYGVVRVTSVRPAYADRMHVYGYVSRGFGSDDWDCTFRADGQITDFDL